MGGGRGDNGDVEPIGYPGSDIDDSDLVGRTNEVDDGNDDKENGIAGDDKHSQDGKVDSVPYFNETISIQPTRAINYGLESDRFVRELLGCFEDRDCRILYFHFGKTGGKDIEYRMSLYMKPPCAKACCGNLLMKRFRRDPNSYCGGLHKFASFEVTSTPFLDTIVPTCLSLPLAPRPKNLENQNMTETETGGSNVTSVEMSPAPAPVKWPTNTTSLESEKGRRMLDSKDTDETSSEVRVISGNMKYTAKSRAIILATFREPHQRTLSYIHQHCNKYFRGRPKELQEACKRCDYHNDTAFWNQFVGEKTNEQYEDLSILLSSQVPNTQVLYVDLADLGGLFSDLYNATEQHRAFDPNMTHRNPEKVDLCNFSFGSGMFKVLRPSTELYREWTLGNV